MADLKFLSPGWMDAFKEKLNANPKFTYAARLFSGRIGFKSEDGFGTIVISDGAVISAIPYAHPLGVEIVITGTNREWDLVCQGKSGLFNGTTPGVGELGIEGSAFGALTNGRIVWTAIDTMVEVSGQKPPVPAYSPAAKPSGKQITGRYIMVDGVRTFYEEAGEGQPIVCFHAASQDTLQYRDTLERLSDAYRVITLDAPGHAKTLMHRDGAFTDITQFAEFYEAFMAELGLVKPVIVGCSMGGNVVLELGGRKPDNYAAIVSAEGADYTPGLGDFLLEMLLYNGNDLLAGNAMSLTGNRTPPERAQEVVWQICRSYPEVAKGDLTGYKNFDKRDIVGNITCPTMLLRGNGDWLVDQGKVEATQSRIPGSRIKILEGTGHYPMTENPYEFNEAIREFLVENGIK